jgi:hypothetical protein
MDFSNEVNLPLNHIKSILAPENISISCCMLFTLTKEAVKKDQTVSILVFHSFLAGCISLN